MHLIQSFTVLIQIVSILAIKSPSDLEDMQPLFINTEYILPTSIISQKVLFTIYATNKTGTIIRIPTHPLIPSLQFDQMSYRSAHHQIQVLSKVRQLEGVKVNSYGHMILAIHTGSGIPLLQLLLNQRITSYTDLEKIRIAALNALERMHKLNVSHNDITLCNILVEERGKFAGLIKGKYKAVFVNYEHSLIHTDWVRAREISVDIIAFNSLFKSIILN